MKIDLRSAFQGAAISSPWNNREPVREELFSVERLEEHARSLAAAQIVSSRGTKGRLLARRLAHNRAALLEAYRSAVKAINESRPITPAAEWLVDNYHLVEKQLHQIHSDLPPGYYRQLPKLAAGPFAGYPRVFGIAWAFVAHSDSRFDPEALVRFVRAYQEVQPLTIGELWAVSITLRIVLIENLGRLGRQITNSRAERQIADGLADRLLGAGGRRAESAAVVLATHERQPLSMAFAVQLVHRLRDQDPKITPALKWLDERLAIQDATADTAVRDVHRQQGAANVSVRNIITSLRLISDVDWKQLFERLSLVDAVLAAEGGFASMDFPTRTLYRSAIEELSRGSDLTETRDRRRRDGCSESGCRRSAGGGARSPRRRGLHSAHRRASRVRKGDRATGRRCETWRRGINRSVGVSGYLTAILLVAAILLAAPLLALFATGVGRCSFGLLGALGAIPAIDAAVALVNRAVNAGFAATLLPAMELARRRACAICARSSPFRRCSQRRTASKSRSSAWKSIISRARKAICISRC